MMRSSQSRLFALAATLFVATSLPAATSSEPLRVTADVPSNCMIAVSNLAFGAYDPLAQNATQQLDDSANVIPGQQYSYTAKVTTASHGDSAASSALTWSLPSTRARLN